MAAKQYDVYLVDSDANQGSAVVDGITLEKGAGEPAQLTQKQIDRLKDAGVRLRVENTDEKE